MHQIMENLKNSQKMYRKWRIRMVTDIGNQGQ